MKQTAWRWILVAMVLGTAGVTLGPALANKIKVRDVKDKKATYVSPHRQA